MIERDMFFGGCIYRQDMMKKGLVYFTQVARKVCGNVNRDIHVIWFLVRCIIIILINLRNLDNDSQDRQAVLIKTFVKNTESLLLK